MHPDGCTVVYPENLFNLRSVRERTQALHKLSLIDKPVSAKGLSPEDRQAFLALLAPADPEAALVLNRSDAHFAFGVSTELELVADGRSVFVPLGDAFKMKFPEPYPHWDSKDAQHQADIKKLMSTYALRRSTKSGSLRSIAESQRPKGPL